MEEIIQLDKQLLLLVNGSDSVFLDYLVLTLTNAKTWIPLYLGLFFVVCRTNKTLREILLVVVAAGLCVLLAGTVDDEIVKPLVARWRPTHDPQIGSLVDVVNDYRGGNYGFFSAHASNTFSLALFFSLLMRRRLFIVFMVCWSLTNCWTRLYLGVHYPGDITVGLLWGALVGYSVYRLYCRVTTPAVYEQRLTYIPVGILCLTVVYAFVRAGIECVLV
ncbi:MAG: phosphatase PAP2 family protein [Prevotella sp.]|nr:phosphatase PAP2 family protein [Prevotella sp.]